MTKKETKTVNKALAKDEKINLEDLTIFELNEYKKAADLICGKYANLLQANNSILTKSDGEQMTKIFMAYKNKYDKITDELEKRLNNIE